MPSENSVHHDSGAHFRAGKIREGYVTNTTSCFEKFGITVVLGVVPDGMNRVGTRRHPELGIVFEQQRDEHPRTFRRIYLLSRLDPPVLDDRPDGRDHFSVSPFRERVSDSPEKQSTRRKRQWRERFYTTALDALHVRLILPASRRSF